MSRRILITTFAVGALLFPSSDAEAQLSFEHPLTTLCSSPTMSFCASFFSWEVIEGFAGPEGQPPYVAQVRGAVRLFGSGYEQLTEPFSFALLVGLLNLQQTPPMTFDPAATINLFDGNQFTGPHDPRIPRSPQRINDLGIMVLASSSEVTEICGAARNPCFEVSVPEPSAWMLMMTGLFTLGFFAWRRREEDVG